MQEAGSQVKGEFPYLLMFQTCHLFHLFQTDSNDTLFRLEREQSDPLSRQSHESGQRSAVSHQLLGHARGRGWWPAGSGAAAGNL
jgi:hypothetical protein